MSIFRAACWTLGNVLENFSSSLLGVVVASFLSLYSLELLLTTVLDVGLIILFSVFLWLFVLPRNEKPLSSPPSASFALSVLLWCLG